MTPFMLYCWQMLNSICIAFGIVTALLLVAIAISLIGLGEGEVTKKTPIIFTILFVVFGTLLALTPSTKQAAIIFGVPMLLEQAQNINADKIPAKLVDYLNLYLDAETKKLKETSK